MTLDEYFVGRPAWQRAVFEEVRAHLEDVGSVNVEALEVGIFFRRLRTFAELRPRRDRFVLSVLLSRRLPQHPRIAKAWHGSGRRSAYFIDLREPSDVDEDVRDWLTEAYLASQDR
jgi:hypothetical protein